MNATSSSTDGQSIPSGASGPARNGILQIHPSLRCNLSCAHCYSHSGPGERAELDAATVCEVISDSAEMGYQVISVSGGEPLLYGGLKQVLAHAKSLGLRTTVTTNGFFSGQERLHPLSELIDVLAISLDGPREIHNQIRGSPHAFERLQAGLENVRQSGIRFGFIHTLTDRNWEHLVWVAEHAAGHGASLLQIHPLELAGRAASRMTDDAPNEDVFSKAYVLAFALAARYEPAMKVQLDLIYRDHLRDEPWLVYADDAEPQLDRAAPIQQLGLIVLEPDGTVVPVSYGFSRRYQVCNVKEQRLRDAWPAFTTDGYPKFRKLCQRVWEDLCSPDGPLLCNWHEVVAARSQAAA